MAKFLLAIPQWFLSNGLVNAGGLIYTYAAGTVNPLSTWSESTGSSLNANPVQLDAAGRAQIWLSATSYKFVVQTSAGAAIMTIDGYNPDSLNTSVTALTSTGDVTMQQGTAATSGANQSSNNLKIQATYWDGAASAIDQWNIQDVLGTGANPTSTLTVTHSGSSGTATLSVPSATVSLGGDVVFGKTPWIDIRAYGASTATADNSTAIQNAINAAISNGLPVFIPSGVYGYATTLTMNSGSTAVRMLGCGLFNSTLKYTGTGSAMLYQRAANAIIFNPSMEGVTIYSSNASGAAIGIEAYNISEGVFRDVTIGGTGSGFFNTCIFLNAANIIDFDHLILNGQSASNALTIGIDMVSCAALQIYSGDYFYFPGTTFRMSGTGTAHITIDGNWIESQDYAITIDDTTNVCTTDGVQITHNRFLFNGMAAVAPAGGKFSNQILLKLNNTGTNSMQTYGLEISENTALFATGGLTNTAYPIVIAYSATTGANTRTIMGMRGNDFDGQTTGVINVTNGPSAAQTQVSLVDNYTVTASRVALTTYVNGTATTSKTFDPFGNKQIFGTLLTTQASINSNDGSAGAPAFSFTSATAAGMYNLGGNVGFSVTGTGRVLVRTNDLNLPSANALVFAQAGVNTANACGLSYTGTLGEVGVGNGTPQDITGTYVFRRLKAKGGTALVTGDVGSIAAGWGNTATCSAVTGRDQAGTISMASAGTGQSANPTFVLTFHDGTWTTAPIITATRTENGAPSGGIVASTTATAATFTFLGTPVAGTTYTISFICMGV